jgi:hypothetical protein
MVIPPKRWFGNRLRNEAAHRNGYVRKFHIPEWVCISGLVVRISGAAFPIDAASLVANPDWPVRNRMLNACSPNAPRWPGPFLANGSNPGTFKFSVLLCAQRS